MERTKDTLCLSRSKQYWELLAPDSDVMLMQQLLLMLEQR